MRIDSWNFVSKTGPLIPYLWAARSLPKLGLGTAELVTVGDEYERKERGASVPMSKRTNGRRISLRTRELLACALHALAD
jgi:hypothetical protein